MGYNKHVKWNPAFMSLCQQALKGIPIVMDFSTKQEAIRTRFKFNEWRATTGRQALTTQGMLIDEIIVRVETDPQTGASQVIFSLQDATPLSQKVYEALRKTGWTPEQEQKESPGKTPGLLGSQEFLKEASLSHQQESESLLKTLGYGAEPVEENPEHSLQPAEMSPEEIKQESLRVLRSLQPLDEDKR